MRVGKLTDITPANCCGIVRQRLDLYPLQDCWASGMLTQPRINTRARKELKSGPDFTQGREIKRAMIRRELFALRDIKVVGEVVSEHNQIMTNPLIKYSLINQSGGGSGIRTLEGR